MTIRAEESPRSLEAMLRTFTPACEAIGWEDYKGRYNIKPEQIIPQEYHPPFVFVSFLDAYRGIAMRLRDDLVTKDFLVFLDREAIAAGRKWRVEIDDALSRMEFSLPLVAPGHGVAGMTEHELSWARRHEHAGRGVSG